MPPAGYAGELSNLGNQVVGRHRQIEFDRRRSQQAVPAVQRAKTTPDAGRAARITKRVRNFGGVHGTDTASFRGRPRRRGGVPCRDVPGPALVGGIIPERRAGSPGISTSRLSVVVTRQILIMAVPHAARAQTRRGGCGFAFAAGAAPRSAPALQ